MANQITNTAFTIADLKEKDVKRNGLTIKGDFTGVAASGVTNKWVTFVPSNDYYTSDCFKRAATNYVPNLVPQTFNVGDYCIYEHDYRYRVNVKGKIVAITDKTVTLDLGAEKTKRMALVDFMAHNMGRF